ncbi:ScbR family autoregulator-binding transcription factor [Streptomyces sp. NPDC053048]|uniref:ScbR family autoregulator-binding transcription factor n=1 Tax=Streptomyces sp. NPDC053048 TaxID=3365694 RepID=UPI0037D41ADA
MQQRSERTRRRLLEAAAEKIDKHGYAEAKLTDISRRAQVTTGALYFHFASKGDLAEAVQRSGCELLEDTITRLLHGNGCSPVQTLIDVTHLLARWVCEEPTVRASLRIGRERASDEEQFVDYHSVCVQAALRLLSQARHERLLRTDVATDSAEALVAAIIAGAEADACRGMSPERLAVRISGMWDLFLGALVVEDQLSTLRTTPATSYLTGLTGCETASDRPVVPDYPTVGAQ